MSDNKDNQVYEFLCVDEFLTSFLDTQALKCAFELGLVDTLLQKQPLTLAELMPHISKDKSGLELLLDLLITNKVIADRLDSYSLSESFMVALHYRDLLEAKIEFSNLVSSDMINYGSFFINDLEQFMSKSRIFDLFCYHRCYEITEKNIQLTRQWMHFTTVYTRYETRVCMLHHDFGEYRQLMDIGGNSGEFVLQLCKQNSDLQATVVDLPVVCEIGKEHVSIEPEAKRITFLERDVLKDPLPSGFDAVILKSLLHDWPEEAVKMFIDKAWQCLKPGGTLLIFERGPFPIEKKILNYSMLPIFLFARFFRDPSVYKQQLEEASYVGIHIKSIQMEIPFFLITAKKE
ncbi:MAG: methyltransferase [Proteobacteria bacterium]|nr:methyltransferase [Pseudomonadota bacterium]